MLRMVHVTNKNSLWCTQALLHRSPRQQFSQEVYRFCLSCRLPTTGIPIRSAVVDIVDKRTDVGNAVVCAEVGIFVVWPEVCVCGFVGLSDVGRLVCADVSSFVELADVISFVVVEYV